MSRQTIIKWESDQALPDTYNLKILCEVFGTSIDEIVNPDTCKQGQNENEITGAIDHIVGMGKRHWQKIGYYLIVAGILVSMMGFLVRSLTNNMFAPSSFFASDFLSEPLEKGQNMFAIFQNFILVLGLALLVVGIILVIYDRMKQKKYQK